jgi:multidrug efflux pump subunit AcrA (membrane-fusion protein)
MLMRTMGVMAIVVGFWWVVAGTRFLSQPPADPSGSGGNSAAPQERVAAENRVTAVNVQTAILGLADSAAVPRSFTGLIKAARASDLGFKRSGRIEQILVRSGQSVAQGQVLACLDLPQVTADLAQARASLLAAQARLDEAVAGPRIETIQAARAQLADARADVKLWTARVARQEELRTSGAVSAQELDDNRFQLEASQSRCARFESQLAELEAGTRAEQIALYRAQVAQWAASVERLEVEVADSHLRAPYDAQVARRDVDEGVVVAAGASILRLVEHRAVEAWVGLPPEYVSQLGDVSHHQVTVGSQVYQAVVRDILPEVDAATRTQTVVLTVLASDAADPLPLAGQMVRLTLARPIEADGFWVPTTAMARGQRGLWALTVVSPQDQTLERRDVELLEVDSDRVLIRGLLRPGERFVTTGLHRLTPNQRVSWADDGATNLK